MPEDNLTSAFILHTRPFKETSLLVEAFTLSEGRVSLVAKGVRSSSKKNSKKALLQPFLPIQINWLGRSNLKTLKQIEANGLPSKLLGLNNLCGLYLNELLLKLFIQWDPHPELFEVYWHSIKQLEISQKPQQVLREFELFLLDELGYGIDWLADIDGDLIEPEQIYGYLPEQGFVAETSAPNDALLVKGLLIEAVVGRQWHQSGSLALARKVCRNSIDRLLDGKNLNSRKLLQQTLALKG